MTERRLRRFYSDSPLGKAGDTVFLSAQEEKHLRQTLRLKEGDACLVTDGRGNEGEAVITAFSESGVKLLLKTVKNMPAKASGNLQLFVYPAFIQKGKMDELVRQMQELAVQGFFPVETERTVVKIEAATKQKVLARWEKIAQEASKQSGARVRIQLEAPKPLAETLKKISSGKIVLLEPDSSALAFPEWQKQIKTGEDLHLFFGPEGGFSPKEISLFESRGAQKIFLGQTILKADTAVLAVASALRFIFS